MTIRITPNVSGCRTITDPWLIVHPDVLGSERVGGNAGHDLVGSDHDASGFPIPAYRDFETPRRRPVGAGWCADLDGVPRAIGRIVFHLAERGCPPRVLQGFSVVFVQGGVPGRSRIDRDPDRFSRHLARMLHDRL